MSGFAGKVAIVTGAGAGLGRAHALELGRRGARVVVNDLGSAMDGSGGSSAAAAAVVAQIRGAGGEAIANGASVADKAGAASIIEDAVRAFGRVDIVINNAGNLRDRAFKNLTFDDMESVLSVHLLGAFLVTKAAWPLMCEQRYGRIVFTTSSSGLYGNFGQSNYGAAKLGLVGMMNTLQLEGMKHDVRVNCVAPVAATRMTENLGLPSTALEQLKPESVTPAVLYLCSETAPSGTILEAGGGYFARVQIVEGKGVRLGPNARYEDLAQHLDEALDMSQARAFAQGGEVMQRIFATS